jgi:hypothetical protein
MSENAMMTLHWALSGLARLSSSVAANGHPMFLARDQTPLVRGRLQHFHGQSLSDNLRVETDQIAPWHMFKSTVLVYVLDFLLKKKTALHRSMSRSRPKQTFPG